MVYVHAAQLRCNRSGKAFFRGVRLWHVGLIVLNHSSQWSSGTIMHQWKRTKRGTRGGRNRRQDTSSPHHAASVQSGRLGQSSDAGGSGVKHDMFESKVADSGHPDSDCSSFSECQARQAAAVFQVADHDSHNDDAQVMETSAEAGSSMNLGNFSNADLSELVDRLYGLVNSLQDENEQVWLDTGHCANHAPACLHKSRDVIR